LLWEEKQRKLLAAQPEPETQAGEAGQAGDRVEAAPDAASAPLSDEPAETAPPEPEPTPAEAPEAPPAARAADAPAIAAPDTGGLAVDAAEQGVRAAPQAATPAPTGPRAAGAPVATTQISRPERGEARRSRRPPSFADILARAQTRLDPADFQIAALLGGVGGATRESFCLSSASGNRDAMNCPGGPNAASARLARYGLTGLGEDPPDFLEDMDRLAFQLRTLGADDNAVTRILTAVRESRREAIETGAVRRRMDRDARERGVDNLGAPRNR
ncbi:MAG: hypothetical protein ACLFQ5_13095, partial [Oceanicaulis sp.]